ncbi:MAG TPA: lycopene cyclase family protein [Pseudonocardia sp.]
MTSVLVVGGGPAGRALAAECAALGSDTVLVDRAPAAPWRATYGAWLDRLPPGLPPPASTAAGWVIARTAHALGRRYAVLDVPALRAHLDGRLAAGGVRVVAGRVTGRSGSAALLADGTCLHADVIVDAGGHRAPLLGAAPTARNAVAAEQTAYGVVVDAATVAALVEPGAALFMDWRPDHGEPGWPTFLYAVPLGGGAVLLEETSLARRPGLPLPVLRRRLFARLAHHGITPPADAPVERVRFPVDRPRHTAPGVLGFGAAAPLIHPATGFSVADTLQLAPAVACALVSEGLPAARRLVWSTRAQAVHRLRRIGLEAVLRMPPAAVPEFFETFFTLPERHQRAYLSARDDLPGLLAAMSALFVRADGRLRYRLVGAAVQPTAPALPT